jgi:hypothetical protein
MFFFILNNFIERFRIQTFYEKKNIFNYIFYKFSINLNICYDHVFLSWTEINFRVIFLLLLLDHITGLFLYFYICGGVQFGLELQDCK